MAGWASGRAFPCSLSPGDPCREFAFSNTKAQRYSGPTKSYPPSPQGLFIVINPHPRLSRLSRNPEPFRCPNLMRVWRNAPSRTSSCSRGASAPYEQGLVIVINPHAPSFSPQWESRALPMRNRAYPRVECPASSSPVFLTVSSGRNCSGFLPQRE